MARPLNLSDEEKEQIISDICNRVIDEKISFNKAVEESEISFVTFFQWMIKSDTLKELYNYAREVRSDVLFEEIIEIADTPFEGTKTKDTPKGVIIETGDMTEHRKLQIDARKWVVAKMQPKKYGDKLDVTTGGEKINRTVIEWGGKQIEV